MLQYLAWIGIYVLSIKFIPKNTGRNSPLWGASFVLFSLVMMSFRGIFLIRISSIFPFLSKNKLMLRKKEKRNINISKV